MTDTITKIYPSDLISDSMVKINHNFEIISNRDDVTESKLNQWVENIENQLADIRNDNGIISDTLLNNVQKLENKINNITNLDGITKEVQNIINNATTDVENLINDKAGEAISSRLGDYVKTSTLNKTLGGYVSSTAFDTYRSDSSKSSAQSSRIVANSKFLKLDNDGVEYLVRISGEITEFKSVEDYFKRGLSASEKAAILGDKTFSSDDKALEDPGVIAKLIEVCERTFKTVISEMSVISQSVGPGNVENTIIATVKNGKTGKDITASIFTKANKDGSEIALNADNINIDSKHALTVKSGGNINIQSGGKFQIGSDNFNIDENGTVRVKGAIEATSLKITGLSGLIDISNETNLSNFIKEHQDDKWLKDALNGGTTIDGGLVLSNAILTKDSADNITAGMIGSNISENDIRFFAGSNMSDINNAPFRVYEDGKMIAGNVELSGGKIGKISINQDGLTVGDKIFIGEDSTYGDCIKITDNLDNVSVLSSDKLIMTGSFSYKTAYLIGDLDFWGTAAEGEEIMNNLQKTYGIYSTDSVGDLFTKYDIINVCLSGDVIIPSDSKYIGRKITFMHGHPLSSTVVNIVEDSGLSYSYSLDGSFCDCNFVSGSNCKFYEDGGMSSTLHLSNEAVEMMGVGIGDTFMGFIITKRYNITTEKEYGHELRCLGMFKVTTDSSSNPSVVSTTYSNQNATISKSGNDYVITTPFKITNTSNVVVNITSEGQSGITYGYSLTSANSKLVITIKSSDISKTFKVTVFNFSDFSSLKLDAWSNS